MKPLTPAGAFACLALAALLAGCGLSAPEPAASPGAPAAPGDQPTAAAPKLAYDISALAKPSPGKFLGLEADGAPDSLTPVIGVAAGLGRKPNLLGQYVSWGKPFDARAAANAWSYGALYYMAWEPYNVTVQAIADGRSDAYITRFARAIRTLNLPVSLSFGHEMNGNWYPWGTTQTPAATFVAAWRHIHDLFTRAGATNVIWVWNPNVISPMPQVELEPYWPGDSYVDWVGLTGYWAVTGPHTFAGVYGPTMTEIRRFTTKPFIVAETAIESGPSESSSAQSLVAAVKSHPGVLGFIWFDYDKAGIDWRVESRPDLRAALATDVAGLPLVHLGT